MPLSSLLVVLFTLPNILFSFFSLFLTSVCCPPFCSVSSVGEFEDEIEVFLRMRIKFIHLFILCIPSLIHLFISFTILHFVYSFLFICYYTTFSFFIFTLVDFGFLSSLFSHFVAFYFSFSPVFLLFVISYLFFFSSFIPPHFSLCLSSKFSFQVISFSFYFKVFLSIYHSFILSFYVCLSIKDFSWCLFLTY